MNPTFSPALRPQPHWLGYLAVLAALTTLYGCSFDETQATVPCEDEGATQNGFVCRDGTWQVDDRDIGGGDVLPTDAMDSTEFDGDTVVSDSSLDTEPDTTPDGCEPQDEQTYCIDLGLPCRTITVDDPCVGSRDIDCAAYIDFATSLEHCGGCDNLCTAADNATPVCTEGACKFTCDQGWVDANGIASDGCEVECETSNGGVEICDDEDNDCDGRIDEPDASDAETYWADDDGDGYGNPSVSEKSCSPPAGFVDNDDDCDDTDVAQNPEAEEICDGTEDDDCDGTIDEECPCTIGQTRDCGTDEGICEFGQQECTDSGTWGDCLGGQDASPEICDGLDNNCDGSEDENFPRKGDICSAGRGECKDVGRLVCNGAGDAVECDASPKPTSNELCDGLDNDCDGEIDNGFGEKGDPCTEGEGACESPGTLVCKADGTGTICDATPGSPGTESCGNDIDDDCDGDVDEGCTCDYMGLSDGICSEGQPDGSGGCDAPVEYQADETNCDGLDNDCDGVTDEGCRCDFDNTSTGVCSNGSIDGQGFCSAPANYESDEATCDGKDNDCMGDIDEGCDDDGDGYCDDTFTVIGSPSICPNSAPDTADDCDDNESRTYPGAAPNESSSGCYQDIDKDGFGDDDPPNGVTPGGDCDDGDPLSNPDAPEICDGRDNNCNGTTGDGGPFDGAQDDWCAQNYSDSNLRCRDISGTICCELRFDGDLRCDVETVCYNTDSNGNAIDDDGDGAANCADPDCDGLSCDTASTCVFDSSSQTGRCEPI